MTDTAANKLTYDNKPIQVESAIRDGTGLVINTTYAKKTEVPDGAVQLLDTEAEFVSNPDSGTNSAYPYRATVSAAGVTASTYVEVTYADEQANSLNYASWCTTGTDVIYLYSTVSGTVTIPTISIGMDYSDITIDSTPTSGSGNPVSSGGVYTALAGKQSAGNYLSSSQTRTVFVSSSAPTSSDGSDGDIWLQY